MALASCDASSRETPAFSSSLVVLYSHESFSLSSLPFRGNFSFAFWLFFEKVAGFDRILAFLYLFDYCLLRFLATRSLFFPPFSILSVRTIFVSERAFDLLR